MSELQSFYVGLKAIIPHQGGVFLMKDKAKGKWEFPGGRVDKPSTGQHETIADLFVRELEEEIPGSRLISVGNALHTAIGDFVFENGHRLYLVFYITDVALPGVIRLSEEHTEHAVARLNNFEEFDMFTTDQAALEKYFTEQTTLGDTSG